MHEGQFRKSGEPYFTHPVAVAAILTEQRLDDATIVTALLHDTIEDTKASYTDVAREFGEEVAELVDGVTKLTNLQLTSTESKAGRELPQAVCRDVARPAGDPGEAGRPAAQHAHDQVDAPRRSRPRKRARRWRSTRRWLAAWGCSGCGKSWRIWPSAC